MSLPDEYECFVPDLTAQIRHYPATSKRQEYYDWGVQPGAAIQFETVKGSPEHDGWMGYRHADDEDPVDLGKALGPALSWLTHHRPGEWFDASEVEYPVWWDRLGITNCREVAPRLFVGAFVAPSLASWNHILAFTSVKEEYLKGYPVTPHVLHFPDGEAVPEAFLETALAVRQAALAQGQTVLLHCAAGLSRSASVAYALLRYEGMDHEEALKRVRVPHYEEVYPLPSTLASAIAWVNAKLEAKLANAPSEPMRRYRDLESQLVQMRQVHEGRECPEEESLVEAMASTWYDLTSEEKAQISSEGPKTLLAERGLP